MRIEGVDLPRDKRAAIGLTYIFGVGRKQAATMLEVTEIDPNTKIKDLSEGEIAKLREYITKNLVIEGDLRRETSLNIKRLIDISCYRGIRHRRGLPVRGQSSKTNARTRKGPRRTVANKKK